MAAAAAHAGLIEAGELERLLEDRTRRVTGAYLSELDEVERVKAEDFLRKAKEAADAQWHAVVSGSEGAVVQVPPWCRR
jgi:hypothetical protein